MCSADAPRLNEGHSTTVDRPLPAFLKPKAVHAWASAPNQICEHHGLADLGMLGGGEQSQRLLFRHFPQVLQRFGPLGLLQLGPVAAGELLEARRVVAV